MAPRPSSALALCTALLVGAGCYARSIPLEPVSPAPPRAGGEPASATVGIRARSAPAGNVPRIQPGEVAARFAHRLDVAGVFAGVVYPLSELAPVEPDLVLDLAIGSRHDFHPLANLARSLAVGVSLLLLQPVLPTSYDLSVDLTLGIRAVRGPAGSEVQETARRRFEYTWLQPSEASLAAWHEQTADDAIGALVARLERERDRLWPAGPDRRPRSPGGAGG